jgi:peptide subunit release factor 1 (eRF1)
MDRDHEKHVQWHAKRVADELAPIIDRAKLTRIVVGGPVEAISVFTAELPKRIQQMIVGTISTPVDAGNERLLAELRDVREKAEQEDESRTVDGVITAAMKADRAVLGVTDTLAAIQEGRVYRLILARDFRIAGNECNACHILMTNADGQCSFCGGKLEAAPDLINRAAHRVIELGGTVQHVSGEAASKLGHAGMAAVLRF